MGARRSFTLSFACWIMEHSPVRWLPGPRDRRKTERQRVAAKGSILATGLARDHACASLFDSWSLCGLPVYSFGGPGHETNCRACRRILRKLNALDGGAR